MKTLQITCTTIVALAVILAFLFCDLSRLAM